MGRVSKVNIYDGGMGKGLRRGSEGMGHVRLAETC